MFDYHGFKHLGGGRKGVFLLLRYVFIAAASYLLIFESNTGLLEPSHALMIAIALASNVILSFVRQEHVFSWYVEAPVLIADTLWVSWALNSTGTTGQEFFLLYFFVLFVAALGESLVMVLLGSTLVSIANVYFASSAVRWSSQHLLRITFFYAVALFYGHVLSQIRHQRQRADKGFAWARELEAEVRERTAELTRLYDEACAANRLKSEFVANMSHELRTPLHIIMGYAELLLDTNETPEEDRRRMLARIFEAARSQADLVQSVLDIGKVEAGKVLVDPEPVVLDRFARSIQQKQRLPLADGVQLAWCIPPALPLIETDPGRLAMVLDNLINNAIKFTSAGTITVSIRDLPHTQSVEFHVEDTGMGIAEDALPTIFEAFRQVDASLTRQHDGVGLGLTIVEKYVALLGGRVDVRSQLGSGSTFIVTLPYRAPTPNETPLRAKPAAGSDSAAASAAA